MYDITREKPFNMQKITFSLFKLSPRGDFFFVCVTEKTSRLVYVSYILGTRRKVSTMIWRDFCYRIEMRLKNIYSFTQNLVHLTPIFLRIAVVACVRNLNSLKKHYTFQFFLVLLEIL